MHLASSSTSSVVAFSLPSNLNISSNLVTPGLASRLLRYAINVLAKKGFDKVVSNWNVEIYSVEDKLCLTDTTHCVRWENDRNGYIEVSGIHVEKGIPTMSLEIAIG